jgi:general secretion pathway protein G
MRNVLTNLLSSLSARRDQRRGRRPGQAGMTLLEIMIVLAILALVMGLLIGPKVMEMFSESKDETAKMAVRKLASEGATHYTRHNPSKACPDNVEQLGQEIDMKPDPKSKKLLDAWGSPYVMFCGANLPPGARGIAVMSLGPDQKQGTADDIRSWD